MAKKEVKAKVKLQLPAGKATPAPPVGPVVSPLGINIRQFCDEFNNQTKDKAGFTIPVELTVYKDKTFSLLLKQPPVYDLILKEVGISKGASNSITESVGVLTKANVENIVDIKMPDFNTINRESAAKMVKGTARSMGIKVEE